MGTDTKSNNKRIAKNTIALSVRFLLTTAIGIYSSRIILANLGVSDYGVYNVVGGIIGMFSFLNSSILNGAQRFLNFYLGKNDEVMLNKVFRTSMNIFIVLGLIVVLLCETVGIYMLNTNLNIPSDRIVAANWVLQFTIVSAFINIISTPYNALIVAYERMTTFAYVAIVNSILNLSVAFAIAYSPIDRLMAYGFLIMLIYVGIRIFYSVYCNKSFPNISYRFEHNRELFKEMFAFSSWTLTGTFAYMTFTQGITILTNVFFGTVINAAQAVANQLNAQLAGFANNFVTASKPQIVKFYAEGNMEDMKKLIFLSVKMSYMIMLSISIPFLFYTDYILELWLKTVPEMTSIFVKISLLNAIFTTFGTPLVAAIHATGKVRNFQIADSLIFLLILPFTYIVFSSGGDAYWSYIIFLLITITNLFIRLYFYKIQLGFSIFEFLIKIFVRLTLLGIVCCLLAGIFVCYVHASFISFCMLLLISLICVTITSLYFAFDKDEKNYIFNKIKTLFARKI